MIGCKKRKTKICVYVTPKYTNYNKIYIANFPHYRSKYQANIKARKEKKQRKREKKNANKEYE